MSDPLTRFQHGCCAFFLSLIFSPRSLITVSLVISLFLHCSVFSRFVFVVCLLPLRRCHRGTLTAKKKVRKKKEREKKQTQKIKHTRKKIANTDDLISFPIRKKNRETRCKRNAKQERPDSTIISQTKLCSVWQVQHAQERRLFIYIHSHTHHDIRLTGWDLLYISKINHFLWN